MDSTITTTLNGDELYNLIAAAVKKGNSKNDNPAINKAAVSGMMNQGEAAKFLGVSLPTIIRWKKQKKIPYYQQGRVVLFDKTELLTAMQKNKSLLK